MRGVGSGQVGSNVELAILGTTLEPSSLSAASLVVGCKSRQHEVKQNCDMLQASRGGSVEGCSQNSIEILHQIVSEGLLHVIVKKTEKC